MTGEGLEKWGKKKGLLLILSLWVMLLYLRRPPQSPVYVGGVERKPWRISLFLMVGSGSVPCHRTKSWGVAGYRNGNWDMRAILNNPRIDDGYWLNEPHLLCFVKSFPRSRYLLKMPYRTINKKTKKKTPLPTFCFCGTQLSLWAVKSTLSDPRFQLL